MFRVTSTARPACWPRRVIGLVEDVLGVRDARLQKIRFSLIAASLALISSIPVLRIVDLKPVSDLAVLASIILMTGYCILLLFD